MASFDVVLRSAGSLHPDGEPDRFVSAHAGVITHTDDETGEATRVGRVFAYRIDANLAIAAGEPLFDVCDCHSQELHELHALLYEPGGYAVRADLADRYHVFGPDVLVLEHVILAPEWRGLRLGLLAARKVVDLLGGGCDLAVSYIAPLRQAARRELRVPAAWLPRHRTRDEHRGAVAKLRGYFRRMGFRRLGRTRYYVLPLNLDAPAAEDLLAPPHGG